MESVESNIAGRISAKEVIEIAAAEAEQLPDQKARIRFWQELERAARSRLPTEPKQADRDATMTQLQADNFSRMEMPYGKYAGTPIGSVPLEYLLWLHEQDDEFKRQLRRYLKSERPQVEQQQDQPDQPE